MKFKPLHDRVLVKRSEEEEKSAGGIIIPDSAKEKPTHAKVIAVGPGKIDDHGKVIAMAVKEGDKVLIGKYSGTDIKLDGVEHVIVREDEILGIVT
jgi:chaperonin GroES